MGVLGNWRLGLNHPAGLYLFLYYIHISQNLNITHRCLPLKFTINIPLPLHFPARPPLVFTFMHDQMSLRRWDRNSLYISQASEVWYKCSRMRKGNETACVLCELSELGQLGGGWGRVKLQRRGSQPVPERCKARWVIPAQLQKQESDKIWIFTYKWEFRFLSFLGLFVESVFFRREPRLLTRRVCCLEFDTQSHVTKSEHWNNVDLDALLVTALRRPLLSCCVMSLG